MEQSSSHNTSDANEVKVTVTVVLNASFTWIERPTKNLMVAQQVAAGVTLGLIAVTAVTLNVCLIIAILCSSNLKKVLLNQLTSVISTACVLDCIINVPFSVHYIRADGWTLGTKLCKANAICVLLVHLVMTWCVCGMCIDRWWTAFHRSFTRNFNKTCKRLVLVALSIVACLIISIPISTGIAETRVFPMRYSCSIKVRDTFYLQAMILVLFGLPIVFSLFLLLVAFVRNLKDIKYLSVQRPDLSYAELFFEESNLWNDWRNCKFVGCITVLYLFLGLPFILIQMEFNFNSSSKNSTNFELTSTNTTQMSGVQLTHPSDKIYFWSKCSFCLLFPLVNFCLRRDVRRRINIMMSFFKTNTSIVNASAQTSSPTEDNPNEFLVPQPWRRRRLSSVANLASPIAFGSKNVQFQFMDLTTGIATWKANYETEEANDKRACQCRGSTFFDDNFEDEEEFTEFMKYEDITEEEINSSEEYSIFNKKDDEITLFNKEDEEITLFHKRDVLDRTHFKCDGKKIVPECRTSDISVELVSRRISKSFNTHSTNSILVKQRNYSMTFPKMPPNKRDSYISQELKGPSDLIKALKSYRSNRGGTAVLPRGTDQLLDSPSENRDVVSL